MYKITKRFSFSASHQLTHLPKEHPCSRLHGHNYEVEVVLESEDLNPATFFVKDYRDLDEFKQFLDTGFDHRHLNDICVGFHTTAENLAKIFYEWCAARWPQTTCVRVSETPKTWAEYYVQR